MFLKARQKKAPDNARSTLEQAAVLSAAPGQRILGYVAAVGGALVILGGVGWKYVLPVWSGKKEQSTEQAPKVVAKQSAPKLDIPLDLDENKSAATDVKASNDVFQAAGDSRPSAPPIGGQGAIGGGQQRTPPPGMSGQPSGEGSYASDGSYQGGGQGSPAEDPARRKMKGDLGNFGDKPNNEAAAEQQPTQPARPTPSGAGVAPGTMFPNQNPAMAAQPAQPQNALAAQLVPIATPNGSVGIIPNPHMTLQKGEPVTCTMDTAIATDVFGFVECITDFPIMSMDGKVVLAERGTRIEGEYSRDMTRGSRAIFVLWTKGHTPAPYHVTFDLNSPGSDALGRSGIQGEVDDKFWQRYGGPLMFSVLQDASAIATTKATSGGAGASNLVLLPSTQNTGQSAIAELLKQGADIKPSLYKNQGDTISITVARYIDFSGVYKLKAKRVN